MEIKPYGSWKSPITADIIVEGTRSFQETATDEKGEIYWTESRPDEKGRYVIMQYNNANPRDITPSGFSARTLVYEYGGGAMAVSDGTVYFSNYSEINLNDQRLFKKQDRKTPVPLTPLANMRYADGVIDKTRERLICIREDHSVLKNDYAINEIVGIDLDGIKEQEVLLHANPGETEDHTRDFYSSPCLNSSGTKLAWLAWNLGRMPWDSNELWMADIKTDGSLGNVRRIAGNTDKLTDGASIFQPLWSPDDKLYFVSDGRFSESFSPKDCNWWRLYCFDTTRNQFEEILDNPPEDAEFGAPQWHLGMSAYGFISASEMIAAYNCQGIWKLGHIDINSKTLTPLEIKFDVGTTSDHKKVTSIDHVRVCNNKVVFTAGGPYQAASVVKFDYTHGKTGYTLEVLRQGMNRNIFRKSGGDKALCEYISCSRSEKFPTTGSKGSVAHAFYYYPASPDYKGPDAEKPPLLIIAHGGPTGATTADIKMMIQYFTTRGFAVADVNYRGSSGYGRDYRLSLYRNWGISDRDDCVKCAEYLAGREENPADIKRVVSRGGSAGGYLTLVLATYTKLLKAGASYYGISDLNTLIRTTHKFESYYVFELVTDLNNRVKELEMRSPVNNINLLDCPMIFFQGLEDKVVPPDQTENMVNALKEKGKPVAEILFPNEQHGFRIAGNQKKALEAEFYFYSEMLGFKPADDLDPVPVSNWN